MTLLPFNPSGERMSVKISPEAHHNLRVVSAIVGLKMSEAMEQALAMWCDYVLTQRQDQSGERHGDPQKPAAASK